MSDPSLAKAPLQLPCSVVILSAASDTSQGAMTASAMSVSQSPPLVSVSASKTFTTYKLIEESKEFAINIIADNQQELAQKFGSIHGYEVDKIAEFGITTEPASRIRAPLISGCYSCMECQVKHSLWDIEGNHAIYIGEVVAFKLNDALKPLVWLNGRYFRVGGECQI